MDPFFFLKSINLIYAGLYLHDVSTTHSPHLLLPSPGGLGLGFHVWILGGHKHASHNTGWLWQRPLDSAISILFFFFLIRHRPTIPQILAWHWAACLEIRLVIFWLPLQLGVTLWLILANWQEAGVMCTTFKSHFRKEAVYCLLPHSPCCGWSLDVVLGCNHADKNNA